MNFFEQSLLDQALDQTYAFIKVDFQDHVLTITLDRVKKKNAMHPHMVTEIAFAMQYAKTNKEVWVVVLASQGDVFCAGADLKAFMGMVGEYDSSIPEVKENILVGEIFNKVHKPVITRVEGKVFAGGFFFLAGATYVVCNEGVRLGLPEVKRGLYPFQVMAALLNVMPKRQVIDWCIRGYDLDVQKAAELGLVTHVSTPETIDAIIQGLIDDISANSPTAIRMGLEALDTITEQSAEHKYLMEMLQKTIQSKDGQEGLKAFREKRAPVWTGE